LDKDVEYDAGLVRGSPQPVLYPGDFEHDLIQEPFVASLREGASTGSSPSQTPQVSGLRTTGMR
jgi:hypothetical protein